MFVGHYALAFAAKRVAPRTSLGTLFAAALFLDLIWPLFVLTGLETVAIDPGNTRMTPLDFVSYPWSHSLAMACVWAAAFGAVYFFKRRDRTGALVIAALVVSHWFLDALTHRPDLPLVPGGETLVGLGLWNSLPATFTVELVMFLVGASLYYSVTTPRNPAGQWVWRGLMVVLVAIYISSAFSRPPPSVESVAWLGLGQWLFVLIAALADKHRAVTFIRRQASARTA